MSSPRRLSFSLLMAGIAACSACAPAFDDKRVTPARGTLGQELYGALCDRVGAQSLREDVTGASYDALCHAGPNQAHRDKVDRLALPVLRADATAKNGNELSLAEQTRTRERNIARVEVLAEERDPLAAAFDAMLPDTQLSSDACGKDAPGLGLIDALRSALSDLVPLYEDETIPRVTRALGELVREGETDRSLNAALARLDARQGYRPEAIAMYVLRPVLSYPRLFELGGSLAAVHRDNRHGARDALAKLLKSGGASLADSARDARAHDPHLTLVTDRLTGRVMPSRPRSVRELSLAILSAEVGRSSADALSIVRRDPRGLASVVERNGTLPFPFMRDTLGLPAVDDLGRFKTLDGSEPPLPFAAQNETSEPRDASGRALASDGAPLYAYYDVSGSVLREVSSAFSPLFLTRADQGNEALFDALAIKAPLLGPKLEGSNAALGFDAAQAPLVDLMHALGATLARPELDDLLALLSKLSRERPDLLARVVRLSLSLDAIADRYPDVALPKSSTLWDELIDVMVQVAQKGTLLEDVLHALTDPKTAELGPVFAAYMRYRDEITYFRDDKNPTSTASLNGKVWNRSAANFSDMHTPVERSAADTGLNRSILQRFLALLHDTNGLSACSKAGAVAHVDITWPPGGAGLPIKLDYPTNPLAKTLCAFLGSRAPDRIPECGILRLENVADLIVDVALGKAVIDVRDDCLKKLMNSPLSRVVGGADNFLQDVSGIRGFNLDPTVPGVARLTFFDAPYEEWGGYAGDKYYPKTSTFLKDVLAPVPSMACPEQLYTDPTDRKVLSLRRCERFEDTLRGRHPNGLFPLEQLGFLDKVIPLAKAFGDSEATPLFVALLDVLHRHWGDTLQSRVECDPSLPKAHARYCTQDGLVAYEPMLASMLDETQLLGELGAVLSTLGEMRVQHCVRYDSAGSCSEAGERDGITVLAEAARGFFEPRRNFGLSDRRGDARALRNDGTFHAQTTPLLLWLDGFARLDQRFEQQPDARPQWLAARSALVDTLLKVDGGGDKPKFTLAAMQVALPLLIDLTREQVTAHCPVRADGGGCAWAEQELTRTVSDWLAEPSTRHMFDTLDALAADAASRRELGKFLAYLFEPGNDKLAPSAFSAALLDLMQLLDDEASLRPMLSLASHALAGDSKIAFDAALVPSLLELLSRFFDTPEKTGCASIDPQHAFAFALARAVTPAAPDGPAPLEVMLQSVYRVNRVNPRERGAYRPDDFASLAHEMSAVMLDPASGLEQVYAIVRQATEIRP